jgi:ubiquinone/menaquinone biosynthesis C-methylase UbiE
MKLNLGCGTEYKSGWVNVDMGNVHCDVKHNIEKFPWPFEDSSVNEILMKHIFEHISKTNFIDVMKEIYRVCENGAIINIESPYAGSDNFWTDPTHKFPMTTRTFDYFDSTKALGINGRIYGWDEVKIRVLEAKKVKNKPNGPDVFYKLQIIK